MGIYKPFPTLLLGNQLPKPGWPRPQAGCVRTLTPSTEQPRKAFQLHPFPLNSVAEQFCFSPCRILVFSKQLSLHLDNSVTRITLRIYHQPLDFHRGYLVPKLSISSTHIPKHIHSQHPSPSIHQPTSAKLSPALSKSHMWCPSIPHLDLVTQASPWMAMF